MKLQFDRKKYHCLKTAIREVREQEQTQEMRLPEGSPDVGSVFSAWGQVILRSKEWRGGGISAAGGVMVWVLYAPEDGSAPQTIDTWVPFQFKWDFPETDREGIIRVDCTLRGLDARTVSTRKIMVRLNMAAMGEALVPEEAESYQPTEAPQGVELLKRSYPMNLPVEAGEKTFTLEDTLNLPSSCPPVEKLIRFDVQPEILDQKIMAGKLVFRGAANLHILYRSEDGTLQSWDFELPFSQFTEMDREFGQDAEANIIPQVTVLELDSGEEGELNIKCGMVAQYMICDRVNVELVEDAYSLRQSLTPQMGTLELPALLDSRREMIHAEQNIPISGNRIVDVSYRNGIPRQTRTGDQAAVEANGQFQILYYDNAGVLQCASAAWEGGMTLPVDGTARLSADCATVGRPQVSISGGNVLARNDLALNVRTSADRGMPVVEGLELGETKEPDPNRPSLILRRAGEEDLWEIAKSSGSTMDAIRLANKLQEEPEQGQLLLIPVP